jgi:hypothetical protein
MKCVCVCACVYVCVYVCVCVCVCVSPVLNCNRKTDLHIEYHCYVTPASYLRISCKSSCNTKNRADL